MSLHVLQLGPYPPPEGGITRNMIAIRDALGERGDRCSIIVTSRSERVTDEPDVHHPRSAPALIKLLRSIRYDVGHLHIGGDVTERVLMLALAVVTFCGRRSVLTMHSGGYASDDRGKGALAKFIFRGFGKVIAVNEDLANVFIKLGVDPRRVEVIAPYALKRPDPSTELRAELNKFVKKYSPLLVSVGGSEPEYEPLMQIAAMKNIRAQHPHAGLIILGGGSMRSEVEDAVAKHDARDSILLAGSVPHDVSLRLMERADAVLRVTQFDGDAISVREALFLGTPVIATDTGSRPNGVYLIEKGSEQSLVEAVSIVISKGKGAPQPVDDGMQNINAVLLLYDELVARPLEHSVEAVAD